MPRIAATALVLGLLLAAPAYAARTVEDSATDQPIAFDINALPPVCRSTLVLPVMNFVFWLNRDHERFSGFNLENLHHTVIFGVEPTAHACFRHMNQLLKNLTGGP